MAKHLPEYPCLRRLLIVDDIKGEAFPPPQHMSTHQRVLDRATFNEQRVIGIDIPEEDLDDGTQW